MTQTVLVAGATGMLGGRIASHLLEQPETDVRLLVRSGTMSDPAKKNQVSALTDRGARVVEGDLTDHASLDRATMGVDVIVCAAQGGPDVTIDGQLALVEAGKKHGVRRILPSDFTVDLFEATEGGSMLLDMRRRVDKAIQASGLEYVHVLNGLFMEMFLHPYFAPGMFDVEDGIARTWGEGDERFEVTSVEDVARYSARAAVDRSLPSGKFAVAGQRITFDEITQAFERVTGRTFRRERRGSIADLQAWIADARATDPHSLPATAAAHQLFMLTGLTALKDLQNDRYPDIHPETYAEYLRRTLGVKA